MLFGDRTYVMGILNITPDSFSDGGKYNFSDAAVKRAIEMIEDGADIIDVGGESTRPQAETVSAEVELERVIPIIEKLVNYIDVPISIDTYKAQVAKEALAAGASIINDIWGLKGDVGMAAVAAKADVPVIVMHNKQDTKYVDYLAEINNSLSESIEIALSNGVKRDNIILDPGFGFGKTLNQNLYLLKKLSTLKEFGLPILVGTSRKSMVGNTLKLPTDQRLEGTLATVVYAICNGANIVRVHDVKETARAVRMTEAIITADLGE